MGEYKKHFLLLYKNVSALFWRFASHRLILCHILLRFGFVEFGNAENCKAVKEAMQDCEIDGSKVTVEYAKPKVEKKNQPAGQRAARGGVKDKGGRGGSRGGNALV